MNTQLDEALAVVAHDFAGAFTLEHFLGLGGDESTAKRRARGGYWIREARGVYRLRDAPPTRAQDLWLALHEAGPGAALSHGTAGRELGHPMYARHEGIDVTVMRGGGHRVAKSRLRETSWLPPEHVVTANGFPVTSLARTMFDLAGEPRNPLAFQNEGLRRVHVQRIKYVVNHALAHLGLTHGELVAVLAALSRSGRPGATILREVLEEFDEKYVPTESDLEDAFLAIVRAYGIEEPVRQEEFFIEVAGIVRVDFLYAVAKLIIEIDGRWHDSPLQTQADRWRDNEFAALGYRVQRFRHRDMKDDPDRVARVLRTAIGS